MQMILKNISGGNKETYRILRKIDDTEPWYQILYYLRFMGQELNGKLLNQEKIRLNEEEFLKPWK